MSLVDVQQPTQVPSMGQRFRDQPRGGSKCSPTASHDAPAISFQDDPSSQGSLPGGAKIIKPTILCYPFLSTCELMWEEQQRAPDGTTVTVIDNSSAKCSMVMRAIKDRAGLTSEEAYHDAVTWLRGAVADRQVTPWRTSTSHITKGRTYNMADFLINQTRLTLSTSIKQNMRWLNTKLRESNCQWRFDTQLVDTAAEFQDPFPPHTLPSGVRPVDFEVYKAETQQQWGDKWFEPTEWNENGDMVMYHFVVGPSDRSSADSSNLMVQR
ncbi:uncharacterized protein I303_106685 [Kwoniella dejecticola CBS 10117]|uniref:Uncharacterized protein n=1 Tax=Kwoniella dejecticola CBS 10117 TaxID=1296121 RepID=A0A1A5ZTZ6_9TREE|nr:uncharacterized protein I303_08672 [Kwoniella dejecticola CBS 10117]OBR81286.1 hypothetical protein I303_08672 [Kwoniella dejecticola CBS 10117]